VVGAVLGIGLVKGVRSVNMKVLLRIVLGWITTPAISIIVAYLFYGLFFKVLFPV
jgi:inorganic phosphate transporter, PiT family